MITQEQKQAAVLAQRRYRKKHLERVRKRARDWAREDRKKPMSASLRWYHANPDRAKNCSLMKNHGITIEDFNRMLKSQGGLCAVCSRGMKKACVDHDHTSGKIRELLCHPCNIALGMLRDSPDTARKAALYLEKHSKA